MTPLVVLLIVGTDKEELELLSFGVDGVDFPYIHRLRPQVPHDELFSLLSGPESLERPDGLWGETPNLPQGAGGDEP